MNELAEKARQIRRLTLKAIYISQSGHPGPSLSIVEILTTLLFSQMKLSDMQKRDLLILSKGHAAPSLYAALCLAGYIKEEELYKMREVGSALQGHPVGGTAPLIDASTGSLGQGLSMGIGFALGVKLKKEDRRVYVVIGDGECQEGQVWEAAMSAPKFRLDNLVAILDYNKYQNSGSVAEIMPLEPIRQKWEAFGWAVHEADGHDFGSLQGAFSKCISGGKPHIIIANTKKGAGISFMEGNMAWHSRAIKPEDYQSAMKELGFDGQ